MNRECFQGPSGREPSDEEYRPNRTASCWLDGSMVLRWAAASHLAAEKNYRRIMGHEQLWMLKAHLDQNEEAATVAAERKLG